MKKIISLLAACGLILTSGCSDNDDVVSTPIATPETTVGNATYNTLTFSWDPIEKATQYAYEFLETETGRLIEQDVIAGTTVTFTGLEPSTSYTLKVKAFGAVYSENGTSAEKVMEARTSDIIQLATPQLTVTENDGVFVISWNEIEGNESYRYRIVDEEGELVTSGAQTSTSVTCKGYDTGTYTVSVTATTKAEGYRNSEAAKIEFTVLKVEQWRVEGTYTCGADNTSWKATLVSYTDGSYSIKAFYGVEGYNLDFYMDYTDPEDTFYLSDSYEVDSDWYVHVPTGKSSPSELLAYPWWNASTFEGDESSGEMWLCYMTDDWTYDSFIWESSVDKFVGAYAAAYDGDEYLTDDDWVTISGPKNVQITKINSTTLLISPFMIAGEAIEVTYDEGSKSLVAQPQPFYEYYTLGGPDGEASPFHGTVSMDDATGDITITFDDFNAWYGTWSYLWDPVVTLTKKK